MEEAFWHEKWATENIGFHESEANKLLVKYFPKMNLKEGQRIFLPLCGKTLDIGWFLDQGYRVVGAELSAKAINELFDGLGITPKKTELDGLTLYQGPGIDVFVGNIFKITPEHIGSVDMIFDRAALVALPKEMRVDYTEHLRKLTDTAPQLLLAFTYKEGLTKGPPFSVDENEIKQHYASAYEIMLLDQEEAQGRLRGAQELVWQLISK